VTGDEFLARPGQTLSAHLDGVRARAITLAPDGTTPAGDDWETLLSVAATLHDIGKYTPAFQKSLGERGRPSPEAYHADVGAVATACALWRRDAVSPRGTLAATLAVDNHHGGLPNATDVRGRWRDREGLEKNLRGQEYGTNSRSDGFALADWKLDTIQATTAHERFERVADGLPWKAVRESGVERFVELERTVSSRAVVTGTVARESSMNSSTTPSSGCGGRSSVPTGSTPPVPQLPPTVRSPTRRSSRSTTTRTRTRRQRPIQARPIRVRPIQARPI
jgi:CRISPR-associated endonuclease Cas3-HD